MKEEDQDVRRDGCAQGHGHDPVRCRERSSGRSSKSRHYILKFLARPGLVYREGKTWTGRHWVWLRTIQRDAVLETEGQVAFGEFLALLDYFRRFEHPGKLMAYVGLVASTRAEARDGRARSRRQATAGPGTTAFMSVRCSRTGWTRGSGMHVTSVWTPPGNTALAGV